MNALHALLEQGQSIWYDFISRDFIGNGRMKELVDMGLRGMTSNPTIFEKAIAGGSSYDPQIAELARSGATTAEVAAGLFVRDITEACDILRPVHDASNGADGFVSLEVAPTLARDTEQTVAEARQLWQSVDRPNLMIKIPATPEGLPAIAEVLRNGINVNITLIFSIEQYRQVATAYIEALEHRLDQGEPIGRIASVASVFVSRIDSMIDARLQEIGTEEALGLMGKAGVANAKLVYAAFQELFSGERWERLAREGARVQRPLWASTSTKNPDYPDLLYVDNLIGPETVNTVPPETLEAILDHASVESRITEGVDEARRTMERLAEVGVDLEGVMEALLAEGVTKFEASFDGLFEKIESRRGVLATEGIG